MPIQKKKQPLYRRKDASSSSSPSTSLAPNQPHHVMTQPVFLQKIFPFAATSHRSPATFKSVSSSWLETQTKYSGAAMCWAAYCSQEKRLKGILHTAYSIVAEKRFNKKIDVRATYFPIIEQILKACEFIISSDEIVKDILTSTVGVTYETQLIGAISCSHFYGVETLIRVIRSRCGGDNFLKSHLAKQDSDWQTAFIVSCRCYNERSVESFHEESRQVFALVFETMKRFNDVDFWKKHLSFKDLPDHETPLMIACGARGRSDLVKILCDTIRTFDFGHQENNKFEFMKKTLSETNKDRCRVADIALSFADQETFDVILNEMKNVDKFHPGFLKAYFTISNSVISSPFLTACWSREPWCAKVLLTTIREISEKEAAKQQNDKNISPLSFLRDQLDQKHSRIESILAACCHNDQNRKGLFKLICSNLAEVGLLMKQYNALSGERKEVLKRYKIDVTSFEDKV